MQGPRRVAAAAADAAAVVADKKEDAVGFLMREARKRSRPSHTESTEASAGPKWLQAPQRGRGGRVQVFSVPYSEHSSFEELCEFVRWLRPVAVVPTVNCGECGSNVAPMLRSLASGM
jgi:hypothetical protein